MHTACVLDDAEQCLRALWLGALDTTSEEVVTRLVDASHAVRRAIRALDDVLESQVGDVATISHGEAEQSTHRLPSARVS